MILKEAEASETNLEVISCAGSSGILEISWGAHKSYVHKITDSLQRAGMNVEVVKEIDNYENYQL
jgi:reverse gyrase